MYSALIWPEVIKLFHVNSTEREILTNHKNYSTDKSRSFSYVVFIMLINVKMSTTVDI